MGYYNINHWGAILIGMIYELPPLAYGYDALEPYLDAKTMEIHHSKHHATYVTKLNEALAKHPEMKGELTELLQNLDKVPEDIRTAVKNHGGGHLNHSLFWENLSPDFDQKPTGKLLEEIKSTFGSWEDLQEKFLAQALGVFGSGWGWLVLKEGRLELMTTPNQDSPLSVGTITLLGVDVWEHAYYLKYQNRRVDYLNDWWRVVNWRNVEANFE